MTSICFSRALTETPTKPRSWLTFLVQNQARSSVSFSQRAKEPEEKTIAYGSFSLDPVNPHLIYVVTNAYGDCESLVSYDVDQRTVTHITTPNLDISIPVLKPIAWEVGHLGITDACIYFIADVVEGWNTMYALPLAGPNKNTVVELRFGWEGDGFRIHITGETGIPMSWHSTLPLLDPWVRSKGGSRPTDTQARSRWQLIRRRGAGALCRSSTTRSGQGYRAKADQVQKL